MSQILEDLIDTTDPETIEIRWSVKDIFQLKEDVTQKTSLKYIGDDTSFILNIRDLMEEYYESELGLEVSEISEEEDDEDYGIDISVLKIRFNPTDPVFDSSASSEETSDFFLDE